MSDSPNTILLIADISGYTRFMKQHSVSVSHAKQIIVRLLRKLMQAAKPPLRVAELEGDAVFFYARPAKKDVHKVAEQIKTQVMDLFDAFTKELKEIDSLRTCSCYACDHVHDLQLKQVMHAGDVEMEKIEQFEKLFGLDVILVHRMLKNSVPASEYVMMTVPMYYCLKDFYGLQPERRTESFEGIGEMETLVFYPHQMRTHIATMPMEVKKPSSFRKLIWRMHITLKTLRDVFGVQAYKGSFRNLPA